MIGIPSHFSNVLTPFRGASFEVRHSWPSQPPHAPINLQGVQETEVPLKSERIDLLCSSGSSCQALSSLFSGVWILHRRAESDGGKWSVSARRPTSKQGKKTSTNFAEFGPDFTLFVVCLFFATNLKLFFYFFIYQTPQAISSRKSIQSLCLSSLEVV